MTDPYLLLTPVLALAVLALARFVGCDWVFRLDEVPPQPTDLPFVKSFDLGTPRTDPANPFTGWVGMTILVGADPITVTQLGRIMLTASTAAHDIKLVQPAGPSGGVDLGTVTIPPSAAIMPSASNPGFAYATLQPTVVLLANTEYYVVSHETTPGDVWHNFDTTVTPVDVNVAQVRSGVFNDDNNPAYQPAGGPGNTYGPVDFKHEAPA